MDPKVLKIMQGASGASGGGGWEILAYTAHPKVARSFTSHDDWTTGYQDSTTWANNSTHTITNGSWAPSTYACDRFGRIGRGEFQTHTESNSGANNRTAAGDGDGFYSAAYNKTGLTKIALVGNEGTVDLTNPASSTNHLVYDLVGTSGNTTDADAGTGTYTLISLLQTLSAYNRNNTNWASEGSGGAHNLLFNGPDSRNFTSGGGSQTEAGYSGLLTSGAGKMYNVSGQDADSRTTIETSYHPRFFCFWGINLDSDHDTQVCAAYGGGSDSGWNALGRSNGMGSLSTQSNWRKHDSWRGAGPQLTFWSLWGNDWHSNTQIQNISGKDNQNPVNHSDYTGGSLVLPVGGSSYAYSMQSWPGTAVPDVGVTQNPNSYMCKQVYLLGSSE